jgi:formyl-CoA transferase
MVPAPLSGVRILAVEQLMAMPFGTQLLSDLGAEVIAVETVGYGGDAAVPWRERTGRHKRRIQVKLNDPRGQDLLRRLARRVDVFGENFRPGVLDRYQLGYAQLSELNERLIYASVSGFGHKDFLESPYSDLAAYGIIGEAMSGSIHAIRRFGGQHTGIASGDITTSLFTTIGILAALRYRDLTGKGQYVDVCMTDSLFALAELPFVQHTLAEDAKAEGGASAPPPISYPYGTFPAADGEFTFMVLNDAHWQSFCKLLGHAEWPQDPELADPSTRKQAVERVIFPVLSAWAKPLTRAQVVEKFRAAGLAVAPINGPADILNDPHFTARRMIDTVIRPNGRPLRVPGNPIKLSAVEAAKPATPAPVRLQAPGESTEAVLREELGLSDDDIATLLRDGIVGRPAQAQTKPA